MNTKADAFLRAHPRLFLLAVGVLTFLAAAVLLGQTQTVTVLYKAF